MLNRAINQYRKHMQLTSLRTQLDEKFINISRVNQLEGSFYKVDMQTIKDTLLKITLQLLLNQYNLLCYWLSK